jgi:hypothetical protein
MDQAATLILALLRRTLVPFPFFLPNATALNIFSETLVATRA